MKDIDGIENALEILEPLWPEIELRFDEQNARFLKLSSTDHEPIGRILRAHLVVESFMDAFLQQYLAIENLGPIRLSFFQKASLLPSERSSASFVKPGILQLNAIRNKFGHRLDREIAAHELSAIYAVLDSARKGVTFESHVEAIEAFTPVACAFLSPAPKHIQAAFLEAFAKMKAYEPESVTEDRLC